MSSTWDHDDDFILTANNETSNRTSIEPFEFTFLAIATSVLLGIMTLTTIIGNFFVIAAIILERNLQSVANYLILSLAVADLLVAVLVMPLGAVYEISHSWTFGPMLCDMWTSSDVLCCTASILHLVAIAWDRFMAVTQINYIHSRNFRTIGTMIILIWGISIIVSLAPLLGWKDPQFEDRVNIDKVCIVSQDIGYQIFASMMTFYVPLVIILLLYWRIFMTARNRLRKRLAAKANVNLTKTANGKKAPAEKQVSASTKKHSVVVEQNASGGQPTTRIEVIEAVTEVGVAATPASSRFVSQGCQTDRSMLNHCHNGHQQTAEPQQPPSSQQTQDTAEDKQVKKHVSLEAKRERKAAKTLAIVTGAFIACWLPFFILALFMAIFKNWHFNPHLVSFFLWLGYFNSTLNPIIYTIFSPEFRTAFKRILCGKSHVLNHRPRHLQ